MELEADHAVRIVRCDVVVSGHRILGEKLRVTDAPSSRWSSVSGADSPQRALPPRAIVSSELASSADERMLAIGEDLVCPPAGSRALLALRRASAPSLLGSGSGSAVSRSLGPSRRSRSERECGRRRRRPPSSGISARGSQRSAHRRVEEHARSGQWVARIYAMWQM